MQFEYLTLWPWTCIEQPLAELFTIWQTLAPIMLHRDLDPWPCDLKFCDRSGIMWSNTSAKFDGNRTIPGSVIDNLANFGLLYVTLWPWPLTSWTCVVDRVSWVQLMYQIWTRSINLRLSYWWLTTDFSSVLGGAPTLAWVILKMRVALCTKFRWDIVRWYAHTKFKNGSNILLGFQTTAPQSRALLSDKAKNRTF